jgi:3D (Asp-Asp-Asp) domain-containing protein
MKILAKWSVMLTMALTVGFTAVETKVEAASDLANSSQKSFKNELENNQIEIFNNESDINQQDDFQDNQQDNKLVSKTTATKKVEPTVLSAPANSPSPDDKLVKKTALVSKRSAVRSFRATAYCLKGRTATGGAVRRGVVAADRRILPLGTKIYIDAGAYSGMYTVADTGGAVKGNILDVWVPSCSEASRFGRKSIGVSVIGN